MKTRGKTSSELEFWSEFFRLRLENPKSIAEKDKTISRTNKKILSILMNKLGKISFEFMRLHNLTSIYYTTERDTHFYNYTENLHLAWQINFAKQR